MDLVGIKEITIINLQICEFDPQRSTFYVQSADDQTQNLEKGL